MKQLTVLLFILMIISMSAPPLFSDSGQNSLRDFLERLASLRGEDEDIMPLEAIMHPRPVFQWKKKEAMKEYLLKVFEETEEGSKEIWSITVTEARATYPEDAPVLRPEALYYWMVYDPSTSAAEGIGRFYFYLLPEGEKKKVDETQRNFTNLFLKFPDEPYYHFLLATYYQGRGLMPQTVREMALAFGLDPETATSSRLSEFSRNRYQEVQKKISLARAKLRAPKDGLTVNSEAGLHEEIGDLLFAQWDLSAAGSYASARDLFRKLEDQEGDTRCGEKIDRINRLIKTVQEERPFVF